LSINCICYKYASSFEKVFRRPQKNKEMKIPEGWKPIAGASQYAVSPDDYVHNLKTGKPVKRYWHNLKNRSRIYDDYGEVKMVDHTKLTVERYELPKEEYVVLNDYPDYKVTPYGAVWKYRNLGKRYRNNPFIVGSVNRGKGEKEYVRLKTEDGRAHWVRMEKIMEEAYPND